MNAMSKCRYLNIMYLNFINTWSCSSLSPVVFANNKQWLDRATKSTQSRT